MKRRTRQVQTPEKDKRGATPIKTLEQKREEAAARQQQHEALTTREKIAKAMARPGGSVRELKRLNSNLQQYAKQS